LHEAGTYALHPRPPPTPPACLPCRPGRRRMDAEVQALLNVQPGQIDYGEALGQGAFGQVRAATYKGRRVAVKAQDVDKGSEDFAYLVREMKIMVVVKHPNVLQLVGAAVEPVPKATGRERYLLLMEICELGDLRKLAARREKRKKPLSWFQVCFILLGAARGIERLHTSGILHRDIKTENLLVGRGMVCKIGDFGMARQEAVSAPKQMDNKRMTLCGTDDFMAPEILFEEPCVLCCCLV
jgi:serine/threonine protein kinase